MASPTPLAFAALGLLAEAPMHPYEMFQLMLQRREDENVKVRPSTLYHQIGRLVDLGYVEPLGTERAGNRPERTTYAITDHGREALESGLRRMVAEPADEYPEFHLALSHVDNLSDQDAVAALRARAEAIRDRLAGYDEAATGLQAKGLATRFWLDVSTSVPCSPRNSSGSPRPRTASSAGTSPGTARRSPPTPKPNSKETTR